MNSWNDIELLHSIIDLPRVPEDDLIPDSNTHVIPVLDTDPKTGRDYMPVLVTGTQWDLLWWIYRLEYEEIMHLMSFAEFISGFMGEKYNDYIKKKKRDEDN